MNEGKRRTFPDSRGHLKHMVQPILYFDHKHSSHTVVLLELLQTKHVASKEMKKHAMCHF